MNKTINESILREAIMKSIKKHMVKEDDENFNDFDIDNYEPVDNLDFLDNNDDYSDFQEPDENSKESEFYGELFESINIASKQIDYIIYLLDHCQAYDFDEESNELKIIRKNANHIFDRLNNIMKDYGEEL